MKKILFLRHKPLPEAWYVDNHIEYIIRYLGNKYHFDLALADATDYVNNFPIGYQANFFKNPNDYDLLVPTFTSITHLHEQEKYYHKMAGIVWEPGEVDDINAICYASTNRLTDRHLDIKGWPYVKTRIGIDTNLFKPYPLSREDNLLHVGFVGKAHSPRKLVNDLLMPLINLEGIKLMFFSQQALPEKEILYCGGKEFLRRLMGGNKSWIGMPNIYNSLDVLIETDADVSVSFPTIESAACGKAVICSYGGLSNDLVEAGAAIHILPDDKTQDTRMWAYEHTDQMAKKIRDAVIYLRDNPEKRKEMGRKGREMVERDWTWEKNIPSWEEFFEKSLSLIKPI
jgi:glycosyltransferase involved in cell wall biosynthesis